MRPYSTHKHHLDEQIDRLEGQVSALTALVSHMGRLLVSQDGEMKIGPETPPLDGPNTQPSQDAIDKYIRDWRETHGYEDAGG